MQYTIQQVCQIIEGSLIRFSTNSQVSQLLYDSRRISFPDGALFFAIVTQENNGHDYIESCYKKGVRNFVVSQGQYDRTDCNILQVPDTLVALQKLAAFHRNRFTIPVVGITGSNGKTIVKEWLYQLLHDRFTIVRSPKSFNSQIGVPLSVWEMGEQHSLAIFEAGISKPGEMQQLEKIIRPTIGVLTNIGEAHDAGFDNRKQKAEEKLLLFKDADVLIYCKDDIETIADVREIVRDANLLTWSFSHGADIAIRKRHSDSHRVALHATYQGKSYSLQLGFSDDASIQNAIHCWCVLIYFGFEDEYIQQRFGLLHHLEMRMQLLHAINGCLVINDSYSADLTSLQLALQFMKQQAATLKKTVILSDFFESGKDEQILYDEIHHQLNAFGVQKIVGIGEKISKHFQHQKFDGEQMLFADTESFLRHVRSNSFTNEIILLKGARVFHFEDIAKLFTSKSHQTVLKIDLNALAHNVKQYRSILSTGTQIMAMVKAFSYGSGSSEIAGVLQYNNVDYLGVAYADEGVELVKSGVTLPIMVMNAEEDAFRIIVDYNLQPVIFSFELLQRFDRYLEDQAIGNYPVHIEFDTGMNRLGFAPTDVNRLSTALQHSNMHIVSVFSHLVASEDAEQDAFTTSQIALFTGLTQSLSQDLPYKFVRHIANTAGAIRFRQAHFDMVRLGIGLYGVEPAANNLELVPVATLTSTIAQLHHVKKGSSVSYNRRGVVSRDSTIATVRIGYADGYSRRFGNGTGKIMVHGQLVPVIGSVCMDMTMIDVTDVPAVAVDDEVIIFGKELPVQFLADWIGTIPYEILTGVSQRVKRIYYAD